jgi:hypothetical protein
MGLMVHGVVRASSVGELAPTDMDGEDVEVSRVTHEDLAALVTPTDHDEVLPSRANLLHHTRVLERVGGRTTVVPMRFGVVVPDPETLVRTYLKPAHDELVETLKRLKDHVELRLRGRYHEDAVITAVLKADPRAARLRGRGTFEAKMELGERIVAGIEQRRHDDADHVTAALTPHAADVSPGEVASSLDAFLLSFLVAVAERDAFEERVDQLGVEMAPVVELELVGPVPPFSFAARQVHSWV